MICKHRKEIMTCQYQKMSKLYLFTLTKNSDKYQHFRTPKNVYCMV